LEALREVAGDGSETRALEVALALCPDAVAADTPGRQELIMRVSQAIRRLANEGRVVKTKQGDGRKMTSRWALVDEGGQDAR